MTGQAGQARAGGRSESIPAQPGGSDARLTQWLLTGTAEAPVPSTGDGQRASAPPADLGQARPAPAPAPGMVPQREQRGARGAVLTRPRSFGATEDRAGTWLRLAGVAVGVLAAAAAAVSYQAQWRLVYRDKHQTGVSYIQAAIPDLGSLVFACFGIALALHGKRAIRARSLNLACVGLSLAMNAFAAAPGWRDLAIWVMPSAVYALASDTLIGVVRAYVIARHQRLHQALAEDETTPLQLAGAVLLWLLRLAWAPPSTISGFHRWVKSLPAAPPVRPPAPLLGDRAAAAARPAVTDAAPAAVDGPARERRAVTDRRGRRGGTKQQQFLTLVIARYGPLTGFDLNAVSRAAAELAPEAALHPGTARKILRAHVLAAQNGDPP